MAIVNFNFKNQDVLVEDYTRAQIDQLIKYQPYQNATISMMPDCHPGKVTPVGFTALTNISDGIMPMALGGDIGCGITTVNIGHKLKKFDPKSLDVFIRENIPSGPNIRRGVDQSLYNEHMNMIDDLFDEMHYKPDNYKKNKYLYSIGTLGGGNHFIELGKSDITGDYYLTVHTGSRSLGQDLTNYYLDMAQKDLENTRHFWQKKIDIPRELSYIKTEELIYRYLHDVESVEEYAFINRDFIINKICKFLKVNIIRGFDSVHNMIYNLGKGKMLITKGATYHRKDDVILLSFPLNMRDGVAIIQKQRRYDDWNGCLPHGCGRKYSRTETMNHTTVSEFKKTMQGIYCSNISKDTLDESPAAYKNSSLVMDAMLETRTVVIVDIIRPIYNFKAGGNSNG